MLLLDKRLIIQIFICLFFVTFTACSGECGELVGRTYCDDNEQTDVMCMTDIEKSSPVTRLSWSEATQRCHDQGAHLPIAEPPKSCPLALRKMIEIDTTIKDLLTNGEYWVGGHIFRGFLWWEWDVPQPFTCSLPADVVGGYFVWEGGNPNVSEGECVSARYNNERDSNPQVAPILLRMRNCSEPLLFFCAASSAILNQQLNHTGPPTIITQPMNKIDIPRPASQLTTNQNPTTTSSDDGFITPNIRHTTASQESADTTKAEYLECIAKNTHPVLPVVWVKDGAYMDDPNGGARFNLTEENVDKARAAVLDGLQGVYWCEVWGVPPDFRRVRSDPVLVTFKGGGIKRGCTSSVLFLGAGCPGAGSSDHCDTCRSDDCNSGRRPVVVSCAAICTGLLIGFLSLVLRRKY